MLRRPATADLGATTRRHGDGDYKVMSYLGDRSQPIAWHDGECTDEAEIPADAPSTDWYAGTILGPGESHTWHVRVFGDDDPEGPETIEIALDVDPKAPFSDLDRKGLLSAQVAVIDDALPADLPRVSISGGAGTTEGGNAVFTLTASPAPASAISVKVNVSGGYASAGEAGERSVTIATTGTATFNVATDSDRVYKPDGEIAALVRKGDGYCPDAPDYAAVTVADDDAPPATTRAGRPALTVHSLDGDFVVEGRTASFVVVSDRAVPADLTVKLLLHLHLRAGSGHSHYSVREAEVTIPAGESASNPYRVTQIEGDRALNLPTDSSGWLRRMVLAQVLNDKQFLQDRSYDWDPANTAGVDVIDDDHTAPCRVANIALPDFTQRRAECVNDLHAAGVPPGVQLGETDPDKLSEEELNNLLAEIPTPVEVSVSAGGDVTEGASATFTVTADPAPASELVVTLDATETQGSGPDAIGVTTVQQVTIGAGQTSATYTHATHDDQADRGGGRVEVTVLPGFGYTASAAAKSATAAIADDDGDSRPTLAERIEAVIAADRTEGKGTKVWERTLATVKGETHTDGNITEAQARRFRDLHQGRVDNGVTASEPFVELWSDILDRLTGAQHLTPPPTPTVGITGGGGVTEGGSAAFTLTADPAPASSLTVNVTITAAGYFGVTTGSRTVTITTTGTATLSIATTGDGADEPDGSVTATISAGTGYDVSGTQGAATVSVADDDLLADPVPPGDAIASDA